MNTPVLQAQQLTRRFGGLTAVAGVDLSLALHEECGRTAALAGLEWLVTVGGDAAQALGHAAIAAGMDATKVRHVATSLEAADVVTAEVAPGDVVLVKGSRGVKTDVVVDRLVAVLG